jgi:hypothetical protein
VDLPINSMVDLSIVMEQFTRPGNSSTKALDHIPIFLLDQSPLDEFQC